MTQLRWCFQIATATSLVGWLMLICLPNSKYTVPLVQGISVALLCAIYTYLVFFSRDPLPREPESVKPSFFTLEGVIVLLRRPKAALAAWVHLLAFDLVAGLYIKFDAVHSGVQHAWLIPVYLLTMMFGPAGLLAYFALTLALGALR